MRSYILNPSFTFPFCFSTPPFLIRLPTSSYLVYFHVLIHFLPHHSYFSSTPPPPSSHPLPPHPLPTFYLFPSLPFTPFPDLDVLMHLPPSFLFRFFPLHCLIPFRFHVSIVSDNDSMAMGIFATTVGKFELWAFFLYVYIFQMILWIFFCWAVRSTKL